MNNDLKITGPEYVSETEFRVVRAKRRGKMALLLALIPIAGIFAAGFVVYSTVSARYALHKKLADSLDGLKNYSVKIYKIDPDGTKSPWREELYYGDDFEIKLFDGKVIFEKVNNHFINADLRLHGHEAPAYAPSKPFLKEVEAAVPTFQMFAHSVDDLQESAGSAPHTFTFDAKDLNYKVRLDGQDQNAAEVYIQGNTLMGPQRVMECVISPMPSRQLDNISVSPPNPAPLGRRNLPLAFSGNGGDHAHVVAADMNVRGDAFFLIKTDIPFTIADIIREHLDRWYDPVSADVKIGNEPFLLVKYIARDDQKVEWPTTLDVTFSPGFGRGQATLSFKYTFEKPTCYLLPLETGLPVSDLTCYQFLFDAARSRADYFANSFIQKGVPRFVRGPTPTGYVEISGDRPKSVREDIAASFYGHQLIMAGEDVSRSVADSWAFAAHILVFLGRGEEAHNAFSAADALRR